MYGLSKLGNFGSASRLFRKFGGLIKPGEEIDNTHLLEEHGGKRRQNLDTLASAGCDEKTP